MVAREVLTNGGGINVANIELIEFETGQAELYRTNHAMIEMHLPLVQEIVNVVKHASPVSIDHDDLVSVGVYGLVNAIEEYTAADTVSFQQFCIPRIRAALLDAIRFAMWTADGAGVHS